MKPSAWIPLTYSAALRRGQQEFILVHMSGAPADAPTFVTVARERKPFLLEDSAQCAGGSIGGKKVGTFGDMAIFSFQMNKNMTSGGGCVVTNDQSLYQRAVACHDTGYARDPDGRTMFDNLDLCLWGRGYRLDELRAAVLRVQLKKLPIVIQSMRKSKYGIRRALEQFPQIRLRRIIDRDGDTGCFLIVTFENAETAKKVNRASRAEGIVTSSQGINDVVMTEWGLHIYYNIVSLVNKTSIDKKGFLWSLTENQDSKLNYGKGTCPVVDSLFERSILFAIASQLTGCDEDQIIAAFRKVLTHFVAAVAK